MDNLFCLQTGDYVLHKKYGIGRFVNLEYFQNLKADFFKIEYLDNSCVYIPIYNMHLLQFYASANNFIEIDDINKKKLGNSKILKKYVQLKSELAKIAQDLILIFNKRKETKAFFMKEVNFDEFNKFCDFQLTNGQTKALNDIFSDLKKSMPMDRIVCADVGYGKTEIALRASFMVLQNAKKILLIVPTVILASQHYETFKTRLNFLNKNIQMLTRLSVDSENIKRQWMNAEIDILITTSSNDLLIDEIGLIILDEEQHFGAKFKENLRTHHFLQLSATPIPRTLNLALSGIKDISHIADSPFYKNAWNMSIFNFEDEKFMKVLEDAVQKEILNHGKIFFIVPRISFIPEVEKLVQNFNNKIDYIILHSKIKNISEQMDAFKTDKSLIISTNILESGVNIQEANLMVIFHAHLFGMSALHQLRGRVGRAENSMASVIFVVPNILNEIALDRINFISQNNATGSGYSVALSDFDIRGGGTAVGYKQSGKSYGFDIDFYYETLQNEVNLLKNKFHYNEINFQNFQAYLPDENQSLKISFYKKIFSALNEDDLKKIEDEVYSIYEKNSNIAELFEVMRLKILFNKENLLVKTVVNKEKNYEIILTDGKKIIMPKQI